MEKAHDVSVDEPSVAHQAILFILDVLIRNGQEMDVDSLYQTFGDNSFTPQMLRVVGGSEVGLKLFLKRYPSLFTIAATPAANSKDDSSTGDIKYTVRANSGADSSSIYGGRFHHQNLSRIGNAGSTNSSLASGVGSCDSDSYRPLFQPSSLNDRCVSYCGKYMSDSSGPGHLMLESDGGAIRDSKTMKQIEQEALVFFKKQMMKKEEEWLPIVSVAGHASQASPDIRKFVGPQNEFVHFLRKYPDIFVVREEFCGLKGKADKPHVRFPPPSPPPKRRSSDNSIINRSISFNKHAMLGANRFFPNGTSKSAIAMTNSQGPSGGGQSCPSGIVANGVVNNAAGCYSSCQIDKVNGLKSPQSPHLQLSPLEVKAVHYIMRLLHRCGKTLVQNVPSLLSHAPEPLAKTIGQTRDQCVQFFKLHSAIFQLHPDSCVSVKHDAVRALIHKDKSLTENSIFTSSGILLRIFPKYGILNTENNEQVFFDIQSCQFESFGDLTCILHPGDRLWFNALLGPKDGSTKWRSLKTWIKIKSQQTQQQALLTQQANDGCANVDCAKDSSNRYNPTDGYGNRRMASNISFDCQGNKDGEGERDFARRFSSDDVPSSKSSASGSRSTGNGSNHADLGQYKLPKDVSVHTDTMSYQTNATSTTTTSDDDCRSIFSATGRTTDNGPSAPYRSRRRHNVNKRPDSGETFSTDTSTVEKHRSNGDEPYCKIGMLSNDSLRSTSMIDLRSLTSSLPVITPTHNSIKFVPLGCELGNMTSCDNPSSSGHRVNILVPDVVNTRAGNDLLKGCVHPQSIKDQVYSHSSHAGISDKLIVDEAHISVSAQTVSSGEILATNIFID